MPSLTSRRRGPVLWALIAGASALACAAVTGTKLSSEEPGQIPADTLHAMLAEYGAALRGHTAAGTSPGDGFWSDWLNDFVIALDDWPDDPDRFSAWSVVISLHNQLGEVHAALEASWDALGEASEPHEVAARCVDVIASVEQITDARPDAEPDQDVQDRREAAYVALWDLLNAQLTSDQADACDWMTPGVRLCFANQFAHMRNRGDVRMAAGLEMRFAKALAAADFADCEGRFACDHALNAVVAFFRSGGEVPLDDFGSVLRTAVACREVSSFYWHEAVIHAADDQLLSVHAAAEQDLLHPANAYQFAALGTLAHRLAAHPGSDEASPAHQDWLQASETVLAQLQLIVLSVAQDAIDQLLAASPNHPDAEGLFYSLRTNSLFLAIRLQDPVRHDIANLVVLDGYGLRSLADAHAE